MSIQNNYAAILAGGIGSRFWPKSRQQMPKQFLDVLNTGQTMLQTTFRRLTYIFPEENIFVLTQQSYMEKVIENLPTLDRKNIVCEPSRKNTAPAAAYIAYKLFGQDPDANILICPVDHLITDERAFERQVFEALDFTAREKALVTFGIKPTRPDPDYSYIQYQANDENQPFCKVKTFTEKPGLDLARTFLKSGDFMWDSGIFAWRAKTAIDCFKKYLPETHEVFNQAAPSFNTETENKTMEMLYPQLTNISLEFGIFERVQNIYTMPSFFGWTDLGSWATVYKLAEKDYLGNASLPTDNVMIIDAANCLVKKPKDKLVVLQGLDSYIVIDTPDVLLICERDKEKQIKGYFSEIRRNKGERFL